MMEPDKPTATRLPRWALVTLLASLAVNMLVVGVLGGRMWAHHLGHDHARGGGVRAFIADLPEARRNELAPLLQNQREASRAARTEIRALRKDVREAMAREPFDKAALQSVLTRIDEKRQANRTQQITGFVDLIGRMTPQERATFAARGMRHLDRHRD